MVWQAPEEELQLPEDLDLDGGGDEKGPQQETECGEPADNDPPDTGEEAFQENHVPRDQTGADEVANDADERKEEEEAGLVDEGRGDADEDEEMRDAGEEAEQQEGAGTGLEAPEEPEPDQEAPDEDSMEAGTTCAS